MLMCIERDSTPNNAKCIHAAADIPLQWCSESVRTGERMCSSLSKTDKETKTEKKSSEGHYETNNPSHLQKKVEPAGQIPSL